VIFTSFTCHVSLKTLLPYNFQSNGSPKVLLSKAFEILVSILHRGLLRAALTWAVVRRLSRGRSTDYQVKAESDWLHTRVWFTIRLWAWDFYETKLDEANDELTYFFFWLTTSNFSTCQAKTPQIDLFETLKRLTQSLGYWNIWGFKVANGQLSFYGAITNWKRLIQGRSTRGKAVREG